MSYPLTAEPDPSQTSVEDTTEVEACTIDGVLPVALLVGYLQPREFKVADDAESSFS